MLKRIKDKTSGFTIIETMIVLAIAGLIMLIVFLAVPALQRSARNTQRKNDVAGIASAIANYIDNNGGTLPTSTAPSGTTTVLIGTGCTTGGAGTGSCTGNSESVKLGYYVPSKVQYYSGTNAAANDNITTTTTNGYTIAPRTFLTTSASFSCWMAILSNAESKVPEDSPADTKLIKT